MTFNKKLFDIQDLPIAYFNDNANANKLRTQLIKNQVKISECEQGDLENTFFSDENLDLINKQLIMSVFKHTNGQYKIGPQSNQSLIIILRYVFLEHAKHLPYNIAEQIRDLNNKVICEILPNIITQITQRTEYLKTINEPRNILSLPINVSNGVRQNLPSVTTTFYT
jgi:hypothetical protein